MVVVRTVFVLLALAFLLSVGHHSSFAAQHQIKIVNAAFKAPSVDLLPVLSLVKSPTPTVTIELPADAQSAKQLMSLQATGTADVHNWVIFSVKNPDLQQQNLVLTIGHRGFSGSGVLWPWTEGSQIHGIQTSNGQPTGHTNIAGVDAVALGITAGSSMTYAVELTGEAVTGVRLWRQSAFNSHTRQLSFFRGVVLGIAMLFAIGFACLFIIRPLAIFPAATLFGWSAVLFIVLNTGEPPALADPLIKVVTQTGLRGIVEGFMLCGLALAVATLLELRRRSLWLFALFVIVAMAGIGLAGYALYEPARALGTARITFAGTVVVALLSVLFLWQKRVQRARTALLPLVVLVAWTALAGLTCLRLIESSYLMPAVSAGLVMVLVTLGFALAQIAFGNAMGSHYFMRDSGRRALALAGSELSVWDWQIDEGQLYVGPELERALGFQLGAAGTSDLEDWLELIHPADRSAYFAAVEGAERRGRGTFSQEFRLRRADGAFRWYVLRARAVASRNGPTRMIGTLADVTDRKRAEENILADAVYDRITGLPNKALFLDRLATEMRRAQSSAAGVLYVLIVDLDRFRAVNDGLGHDIGDSLLDVTARRIARLLSPHDTLARLPADQFGIVFSSENRTTDIVAFCERLRDTLAQPVNLRPREVFITTSIGVAAYTDPHQAATGLLEDAEIALHEAKRHGRHMVEFFTPQMRSQPSAFTLTKAELQQAIERGEISVLYQPVKRLSDGQLAGFEALARLEHPVNGMREAESFIALAEQTGMVKQVGRYVLAEAARQLGIWQRAFRPSDPLFVTVNVSSRQLMDNDVVTDIKTVLTREGIQPGTLKLELTETALMQNLEMSVRVLDRIKALGVGLACDDFGSGYSAFSNLRRLPFDTLKIDKDFLPADVEDEKSAIILESIILMAHDLQQQVIVEGVENESQIEQLRAFECDYAQGFFVGHPVTAQRIIEALGSVPYGSQSDGARDAAFWQLLTSPTTAEQASYQPTDHVALGATDAVYEPQPAATPDLAQDQHVTSAEDQPEPTQPQPEPGVDSVWPEDEVATREPETEQAAAETGAMEGEDAADVEEDAADVEEDAADVEEAEQAKSGVPPVAAVNDNAPVADSELEVAEADKEATVVPVAPDMSGDEVERIERTTSSTPQHEPDVAADDTEVQADPNIDTQVTCAPIDAKSAHADSEDENAVAVTDEIEAGGKASADDKEDDSAAPAAAANRATTKRASAKPTAKRPARKAAKRPAKKASPAKKGPLAKKLRRAAKTRATKRKS